MTLIYQYPPLQPGILLKRYKRFFADVELTDGRVVTAHCPNTGPMTCISTPQSLVQVSHSEDPKRKLAYTWEMIQVNKIWVGVNTAMPNRVIKLALQQKLLPLGEYQHVQAEVRYGQDSRVDFCLTGGHKPTYVEVKSTTLAEPPLAMFPDTETTRGQKHLRELTALLPQARAVMLYFINREDCHVFAPGDAHDPEYGRLLRLAIAQGLEVLPCRFAIAPTGISYLGIADIQIN